MKDEKNMKFTSTISRSLEIPLRIFGIWPNSSCLSLCRVFWFFANAASLIFQYQYLITHVYTVKFSDLMDGLSATVGYTLLNIKIVIFWLNQRSFNKILAMMAMDWKKSSSTDFSARVMTSIAALSHNFSNLIVGFHMTAVALYSISVIIGESDSEVTEMSARLILKMDLPFDSETRFVYGLVLATQTIYLEFTSCILATINVLLISLVLHLAGQIDILRKWLTEIYSEENGYKPSLTLVKRIIKKHQKIIIFSENIENLYSNIALFLFVADTLTICALGFILVTTIGTPNAMTILMKSLSFYIVVNLEAFIFCFAGEYLSAKSKTIGDAAYNSHWYETGVQNNRIILLLIMRSQNQLTITVGKFMDLSLERFTSILKGAASYVSFLLAMY